jgi:glutamyl-tRNA synthetase
MRQAGAVTTPPIEPVTPIAVTRGRFAPSPTGALHLGNLRTALISWLQQRQPAARFGSGAWSVRMEDLDLATSTRAHARGQLADLAALGLHPDGEVVFQSERFETYDAAIERLRRADRVYECFCTRREIREAAAAPHLPEPGALPEGAYPGTCRHIDSVQRSRLAATGRRPALRLRTEGEVLTFEDDVRGRCEGAVDDVVLRRGDGVPAYNLAVVVDDAAQGITDVVRGDDLLGSTPRQVLLQRLLGLPTPRYAHVPLVLGPDGVRLAKRQGAVTMADLGARGIPPARVLSMLGASLGLCRADERIDAPELAALFRMADVPREPWQLAAIDL